jgi:hypothetical protein
MGRVPGEGKTFACFTRVYDAAHLAAHPAQNVRSMEALAVVYSAAARESYQLRMGFRFRGRPEEFTTVAECGDAVCAGPAPGSMRVALDDGASVLMDIPDGAHLWRPGPPNPKDTLDDAFGPDDKRFRLYRTDLADCRDQMFDYERKALLGGR